MQTPAEKYLIEYISDFIGKDPRNNFRLLNVGAGISTLIEDSVTAESANFVCDRSDIFYFGANGKNIGKIYLCKAESMPEINTGDYDLAFANYVLEHVGDPECAASEIRRILKDRGCFVTSLSNPTAPEFMIANITPLWFHQIIRGKGKGSEAYETFYQYKNIDELVNFFDKVGFDLVNKRMTCFTFGYLYKFPILKIIGKAYDSVVNYLGVRFLMGNVLLIFEKK